MKSVLAFLLMALAAGLWLAGCTVDNSGKKPPYAFPTEPTTSLTVAPGEGDTVNHYFTMRWAGNTAVGDVVKWRLLIDNQLVTTTALTESTFAFTAPISYEPFHHTFTVASVDNDGNVDPQPVTRSFYVTNVAPRDTFDNAHSIPNNGIVGQGFRVTVAATDSNPSYLFYSVSLDDTNHWQPWSSNPAFVFSPPALIAEDTAFYHKVNGVSNVGLTPGAHTLYARAMDGGDALSNITALTFTVSDTFQPAMTSTKAGTYAGSALYPDGSAYYVGTTGTQTVVSFSATADVYHGEILSYRWRVGDGPFSAWSPTPSATVTDLSAGNYTFIFTARDVAGVEAAADTFIVRLVNQTLSRTLLVVDETADQNGHQGAPSDGQVDSFYAAVLSQVADQFTGGILQLDYAHHQINSASYVSPYDFSTAGIILWHGDDRTDINLSTDPTQTGPYRNVGLLRDFLNKGGRLIVSGYDLLQQFVPTDSDSLSFSGTQFGYAQFRINKAWRTPVGTNMVTGFTGVTGDPRIADIPTCMVDSTKTLRTAHGMLQTCWGFLPRGECITLGHLTVTDASQPANGKAACYIYDQSFRVAVFGVPLYYCYETQVTQLMNVVVPHMIQGLQ